MTKPRSLPDINNVLPSFDRLERVPTREQALRLGRKLDRKLARLNARIRQSKAEHRVFMDHMRALEATLGPEHPRFLS